MKSSPRFTLNVAMEEKKTILAGEETCSTAKVDDLVSFVQQCVWCIL